MTDTAEPTPPAPATASVPPVPGRVLCPRCGHTIDSWDNFCRYCGRPMKARAKSNAPWYYEPLWILVLSIAVIGPLALPLVWKSPKLTRSAKWGFTLFHVIYTAMLVYVLWFWCLYMWRLYSTLTQDFGAFR
ncbi:MAG: zinc-ribbon domain-containing protein [Candidatus Hydrogenedentes bacterium]|nr:zinc-ribbon domain-containing protein [Candidatus Hydrogenedentota bacterium]